MLSEVACGTFGSRLIEILLDRKVRAAFDQQPDHGQVPILSRQVKSRDSLTVRQSAKGRLLVDCRAVIQQPAGGFRAVAGGRPDQRRASIRIGVWGARRLATAVPALPHDCSCTPIPSASSSTS